MNAKIAPDGGAALAMRALLEEQQLRRKESGERADAKHELGLEMMKTASKFEKLTHAEEKLEDVMQWVNVASSGASFVGACGVKMPDAVGNAQEGAKYFGAAAGNVAHIMGIDGQLGMESMQRASERAFDEVERYGKGYEDERKLTKKLVDAMQSRKEKG